MDISDLAAAALKPDHIGRCNCARNTKDLKPRRNCPKCGGKGKVHACDGCDGSGWNREKQIACAKCEGKGYTKP